MLRALGEYVIEGPKTLIGFHRALLSSDCFVRGETCVGLVESDELAAGAAELDVEGSALAGSTGEDAARLRVVEVDGRRFQVRISEPEPPWRELGRRRHERERERAGHGLDGDAVLSPMQGTVLAVAVGAGDVVDSGAVICIIEAMKMENEVRAHRAGTVSELSVEAGQPITTGDLICSITTS
jgi:acetyl-CoA/propionyl-CoA carboxylase biotin carboxyl carrier protein